MFQVALRSGVVETYGCEASQGSTLGSFRAGGLNQQASAFRQDGTGVQDQIHDGALNLGWIRLDAAGLGSRLNGSYYALARDGLDHPGHAAQYGVETHDLRLGRLSGS